MKEFFTSALFALIVEALFTVLFMVLVLTGTVSFIVVAALVVSAVGFGFHLYRYLSERNTRLY